MGIDVPAPLACTSSQIVHRKRRYCLRAMNPTLSNGIHSSSPLDESTRAGLTIVRGHVNQAHAPFAIMPPSMHTYSPVMNDALSLARNVTRFAMSCGWPIRPMGCVCPDLSSFASSSDSFEAEVPRLGPRLCEKVKNEKCGGNL